MSASLTRRWRGGVYSAAYEAKRLQDLIGTESSRSREQVFGDLGSSLRIGDE
jgi:hypothetical protein